MKLRKMIPYNEVLEIEARYEKEIEFFKLKIEKLKQYLVEMCGSPEFDYTMKLFDAKTIQELEALKRLL